MADWHFRPVVEEARQQDREAGFAWVVRTAPNGPVVARFTDRRFAQLLADDLNAEVARERRTEP